MSTSASFYSNHSDESLCKASASGDLAAEEALILRYRKSVLIASRSLFLLGGDREDLIQEGMVGLLKAVRSYSAGKGSSFRTYADRCVRNAMISAVRSAARDKHTPLNTYVSLENPLFDSDSSSCSGTMLESASDPEQLILREEALHERLSSIHDRLSGFEVKILGLYLKGLSYSDIALEIGRPVKSVDNAVQRVRKKLAQPISHSDSSYG